MADYTDLIAQIIGGGYGGDAKQIGPIGNASKFPGWRRIKQAGLLEGLGQFDRAINDAQQGLPSAFAAIEQNTQRQKANVAQNTASRGLANTTVTDAMNRGVESDAQNQRLSVQDAIRQYIGNLRVGRANFGMGTPAYGPPPQKSSGGLGGVFGSAFAGSLGSLFGGGNANRDDQGNFNWF